MPDDTQEHDRLVRQCRTFCRYLIGRDPTVYLQQKYAAFHSLAPVADVAPTSTFDRMLLNVASRCVLGTRLADAYSSRFLKTSAVRKKLVLMLALLECTAATSDQVDLPDRGGPWAFVLRGIARTAGCAMWVLAATLVFAPVHVVLVAASGLKDRQRRWWHQTKLSLLARAPARSTSRKPLSKKAAKS